WVGVTGIDDGQGLLACYAAASTTGIAGQLAIEAMTQPLGAAPTRGTTVLDLPAGADRNGLRLSLGSGKSGRRAGLVWGFEGSGQAPAMQLVGEAGAVAGAVTLD